MVMYVGWEKFVNNAEYARHTEVADHKLYATNRGPGVRPILTTYLYINFA